MSHLFELAHPTAHVLLTRARNKTTNECDFANAMRRIGFMLAHVVLEDHTTVARTVTTPLNVEFKGVKFDERVALCPVMRAGNILLEGFRAFTVRPVIWHLSLSRDEKTLATNVHGSKVPEPAPDDVTRALILEVMLATGGSACTAIELVKKSGVEHIDMVCVLAAPEGIARVQAEHPDVNIYVVEIDERLTTADDGFSPGYIWPGLGDAGDRVDPVE